MFQNVCVSKGKRTTLILDQQSQESQIEGQLEVSAVTEQSLGNPAEGVQMHHLPKPVPKSQYVTSVTICHNFVHSCSILLSSAVTGISLT